MADIVERSKCLIDYAELVDASKKHLPKDEPSADIYLSDDYAVVLSAFKDWFLAVAAKTKRLNHIAVTRMAVDRWRMTRTSAGLLGKAFANAYNNCMQVGKKAKTGEKLKKSVVDIYEAAHGRSSTLKCKEEVKREKVKHELTAKAETPSRRLKRSDSASSSGPILSPGRLTALYSAPASIKELLFLVVEKNI